MKANAFPIFSKRNRTIFLFDVGIFEREVSGARVDLLTSQRASRQGAKALRRMSQDSENPTVGQRDRERCSFFLNSQEFAGPNVSNVPPERVKGGDDR